VADVDTQGVEDPKLFVWPGKGVYAVFGRKPEALGASPYCKDPIFVQFLVQVSGQLVGRWDEMPCLCVAVHQQLWLPLESQCCRSRSCESISCIVTRSMPAACARVLSTAACVCLTLPSGCIQVVAENTGDSWSIHRPTELKPGIFAPQLYTNRWDGRAGCESFSGLAGMCA
jgi:hypothetical protein